MIQTNPWAVNQLEDFLYFCCPECDVKRRDSVSFIKHAITEHPYSKIYLTEFLSEHEDPLRVVELENDIKVEEIETLDQSFTEIPNDGNDSEESLKGFGQSYSLKKCFVRVERLHSLKQEDQNWSIEEEFANSILLRAVSIKDLILDMF